MISFNSIPVGNRVPGSYVEFDSTRATTGGSGVNRVLLIGQRLTVGGGVLTMKSVTQEAQADAFFGRGSMLSRMARAMKAADRTVDLVCVALDDAVGSVAATGTITVTGPATAAGTIALMIAGQRVPIGVASGDTANAIAAAIAAAVNGNSDLPVTAAAALAVVTLTARNKGTCGNEIDVRHSYYADEPVPSTFGVTLAIVAMSGGATDPDYSTVWPVIGDAPFSAIAVGTATSATIAACKTELDSRFGPVRALGSYLWAAKTGTQGTLSSFGAALNSQLVTIMGTGKSPTPPWEWAACLAGIANASGNIDPARPLQTLVLPGILGPVEGQSFTRAERELLLRDGISTYRTAADGSVTIERAITTYQVNAVGAEDIAYLDAETIRTLFHLRQTLRARFALKYPRHKLANDGTRYGAGQAIITPAIASAELLALAREWEEAGLVEDVDQYKADLICERNATDQTQLDARISPNLINQFRQFAAQIQFIL